MTLDPKALYQALILDHGKSTRNEGPLATATHQATVTNPLCGDRVTVRLVVEDSVVREARFEARGCLIARASASLLIEEIAGKSLVDALALVATIEALVHADDPPADVGDLEPLRGARDFPARRACVTLAWHALERALSPSVASKS